MTKLTPIVLALVVMAVACGKEKKKSTTDGATASTDTSTDTSTATGPKLRSVAKNSFTSVGMVTVNGSLRCSGLILKHGVFATAKHCFTSDSPAPSKLGLIFTGTSGIVDADVMKVASTSMKELNLDGSGNDIAYVIYDPAATSGKVALTTTNIIKTPPPAGTPMALVGFPSPNDRIYRKLATMPCKRLAKEGTIAPNSTDPLGYDGELYDTDCGAWFGNSGGPLFVMDSTDPTKVIGTVGVVTHTFDIDGTGEIPESALIDDEFGNYVKTVNFSSYGSTKTLDANLAKGQQ